MKNESRRKGTAFSRALKFLHFSESKRTVPQKSLFVFALCIRARLQSRRYETKMIRALAPGHGSCTIRNCPQVLKSVRENGRKATAGPSTALRSGRDDNSF